MKKLVILLVFAVALTGMSWAQDQDSKISICLTGNILMPNDGGYKDTYGKSRFYPELRVAYSLGKSFFVYGSYGLLSASGETPVLKLEAKSTQHIISVGGGYGGVLSGKLSYRIGVGLFLDSYKETAMDIEATGSAIGFRADAGLCYAITDKFSAHAGIGYLTGKDDVEGESIKLGGFRVGAGIGYKF